MEIRLLKYFIAIVNEGSFSKAAQYLNITQPTLSRQISAIEDTYNIKLFDRSYGKIKLTSEGQLFYQKANEIINLTEKLEKELSNNKQLSGTIAIGSVESAGADQVFELISSFISTYPKINFDFYHSYSDDVKKKLDIGEIDFGIVTEPVDINNYNFIELPRRDSWYLLVSKNNYLSHRDSIEWQELNDLSILIPKRFSNNYNFPIIFGEKPLNTTILATYTLFSNAIKLVENNLAVAPVIKSAIKNYDTNKLKLLNLIPELTTKSYLIWKKDYNLQKSSQYLLDYLKSELNGTLLSELD